LLIKFQKSHEALQNPRRLSELEQFDSDIKGIEDGIVQFLVNSPLFLGQNSIFSTIKAYFITRKTLTQTMLKELTGFSAGIISQELKKLINMHIIQKIGKGDSGQILYSMESVELAFIAAFLHLYDDVLEWEDVFQKIKLEMDAEKDVLEQLNGYKTIYRWIDMILNSIVIYQQLLQLFKEEKAALEKI